MEDIDRLALWPVVMSSIARSDVPTTFSTSNNYRNRTMVLATLTRSSKPTRFSSDSPAFAALQARARALASIEIDFISNPEFRSDVIADELLEGPDRLPTVPARAVQGELPKDLPAHLARLCEAELLTAAEERDFFRRMNYYKFRANCLRARINPDAPDAAILDDLQRFVEAARVVRDRIVQANMRLVISVVKKFVTPQSSFDDLLSDGTMTMMNAVDKFDYDRGFRFSTYAYRSIARNAYRVVTDRQKEINRFNSGSEEHGFDVPEPALESTIDERNWDTLRDMLSKMLGSLDPREQRIIRDRYALGDHRDIRTFQSLADKLGVSKERVRQLEQRAVGKLRSMAAELQLDDLIEPVFSN